MNSVKITIIVGLAGGLLLYITTADYFSERKANQMRLEARRNLVEMLRCTEAYFGSEILPGVQFLPSTFLIDSSVLYKLCLLSHGYMENILPSFSYWKLPSDEARRIQLLKGAYRKKQILDPWGGEYRILMSFSDHGDAKPEESAGCARAWCFGPDQIDDDGKNDDVAIVVHFRLSKGLNSWSLELLD